VLDAAFVFCALLEFTLVNYLWRKPVSKRQQSGARDSFLNGGEALTRSISAGGLVRRAAASEQHKICTTTEMDPASASIETKPIPPAQSNKKVYSILKAITPISLSIYYTTFYVMKLKFAEEAVEAAIGSENRRAGAFGLSCRIRALQRHLLVVLPAVNNNNESCVA
jgi:hypothetical protein